MKKLFLIGIQLSLCLLSLPSYAGSLNIGYDSFSYDDTYYDSEDATLYLQARNYNALSMRFISQDTYQYFNRYSGFGAEPITHVDPTGHSFKLMHKANHYFNAIQDGFNGLIGTVVTAASITGSLNPVVYASAGGLMLSLAGGLGLASDIDKKFARKYRPLRTWVNIFAVGGGFSLLGMNEAQAYIARKSANATIDGIVASYAFAASTVFSAISVGVTYGISKGVEKIPGVTNTNGMMQFISNVIVAYIDYSSVSSGLGNAYISDLAPREYQRLPRGEGIFREDPSSVSYSRESVNGRIAPRSREFKDADKPLPFSAIQNEMDVIDQNPFVIREHESHIIAHQADGNTWHPFREKNITTWLKNDYSCPTCHQSGQVFQRYRVVNDQVMGDKL